ncbi:unnamed protein product [Candidula unifasciata]|uniref:Fucosyltransferase n=1 Tax=Candidula unifasciata TaxID=100452 RepID=A0A8S3YKI4_9EUPU|nr:unnamed protein product [Candidula unifasciata]
MLLFQPPWFSSHWKKTMALLIGVTLIILTVSDALLFHVLVPGIPHHLIKIQYMSYVTSDTSSNNFTNNTSFSEEEKKKQLYEPAEAHSFKSPYISTPKIYSTNSSIRNSNFSRKHKVISCYNCPQWFILESLNLHNRDFKVCPYSECIFDGGDRKSTADVLLFFVGALGKSTLPRRPAGQIWVKCYWESPAHYGYPTPYKPWMNAFNWTFNYRTDSDIFAPNNRLAWRNSAHLLPDSAYLEISQKKTRNVAWFVSNCHTQSQREVYVKEMQKYIDVDIYGNCGTHSCKRAEEGECERALTSTYKFYLSFENSLCKDYVTEKLFRNIEFRSHIIPVVRGGFDYNKYIPSGAFINTANFSSAKDLSLYLKELGQDHVRYARMLKEKDKLTTLNYKFDWCDICEKVHTDNRTKVIPDIKEWSHKDACYAPADIGKS